ncbi:MULTISPECIES: hypothetical protein [unclassified Streptomyces]|uniref:hypothetical protein n=1 Tax=unclassified Streptomyces TaxID=2593676 RepID=UPI002E0D95A6|nr:hypothetical protein OG466_41045 [Streptomyces sp. NBC_01240]
MAKLARTVFVRDPDKHQDVLLHPGETPAPHYAVLVTNPACWEGGKLPAAVKKHLAAGAEDGQGNDDAGAGQDDASGDDQVDTADIESSEPEPKGDDTEDVKPAARKTAARKPARGRTTAAEGTSGQ